MSELKARDYYISDNLDNGLYVQDHKSEGFGIHVIEAVPVLEKIKHLETEIEGWKIKNETLRWDNVEKELKILETENSILRQDLESTKRNYKLLKETSESYVKKLEASVNDWIANYEELEVENTKLKEENIRLKEMLKGLADEALGGV